MIQSNEPTIDQMNEAIARFMGITPIPAGTLSISHMNRNEESVVFLNYDEDWSKLMPVVDKIEAIENRRFGVCIDVLDTMIMDYKVGEDEGERIVIQTDIYPDNGDTKISITHAAVYQFITWYNQQTTTNEITS